MTPPPSPISRPCPQCGAEPLRRCRTPSGIDTRQLHKARIRAHEEDS